MKHRMAALLFIFFSVAGCQEHVAPDELIRTKICDDFCRFLIKNDKGRGTIGDNGMRVHILPTFGDFEYRFEIFPQPDNCVTAWLDKPDDNLSHRCVNYLVRMRKTRNKNDPDVKFGGGENFSFIMPLEDGRGLLRRADKLTDRWRGDNPVGLDGTAVGVEIVKQRNLRFVSIHGSLNDDDGHPASWVATELHRLALAYGPTGQIPRLSYWHSQSDGSGQSPCNNPGLNVPDPDGFGTGDDACARSLPVKPPR